MSHRLFFYKLRLFFFKINTFVLGIEDKLEYTFPKLNELSNKIEEDVSNMENEKLSTINQMRYIWNSFIDAYNILLSNGVIKKGKFCYT